MDIKEMECENVDWLHLAQDGANSKLL